MISEVVAIGGGSIGRFGVKVQTTLIDREIIRLTGKKEPRLLFIPTATDDDQGYCDLIQKHFGGTLGCRVDILRLVLENPSKAVIRNKILSSDILYVGGGNTLKMMTLWRRLGVDKMLLAARRHGAVFAGPSAGAICWFKHGNSDSRQKGPHDKTLIRVSGLGWIDALCCPHYDSERHRQASLKTMMKKVNGVAVALEDCAALEVVDGQYRIITSMPGKKAYRVYWKRGKYHRERVEEQKAFRPLLSLLKK